MPDVQHIASAPVKQLEGFCGCATSAVSALCVNWNAKRWATRDSYLRAPCVGNLWLITGRRAAIGRLSISVTEKVHFFEFA